LESKITDILKLSLTILTVLMGLIYFLLSNEKFTLNLITISALALIILASIFGLIAHLPQDIEYLNPKIFYDRHYNESYNDIVESAAVTIADTISNMEIRNKQKSRILVIMTFLIIAGLTALAYAFLTSF